MIEMTHDVYQDLTFERERELFHTCLQCKLHRSPPFAKLRPGGLRSPRDTDDNGGGDGDEGEVGIPGGNNERGNRPALQAILGRRT